MAYIIYTMLVFMFLLVLSPILYMKRSKYYSIKYYGISCHEATNHKYDNKPYKYHLRMVRYYAGKYVNVLNGLQWDYVELILASCWVHDVIEDCRETYNDVLKNCGVVVAEITYALSNEKGKTRKERANDKYYDGILKVEYADFIKICDRLANIKYSKMKNSSMLDKYRKEHEYFKLRLYKPEYSAMFYEMETMLNIK
jgi:(p)ppGpp synthase/HD superfamily hydrolase